MHPCPCCGFETLEEAPPGTFDICEVCGWEDDNVQFHDPDYRGGANAESLRQHQNRWMSLNARVGEGIEISGRHFTRSGDWRPLPPSGR